MRFKRRVTVLFTTVALMAGALLGTAAPAQAYPTDPAVDIHYRDTDDCPCSGGSLGDPFDGTYFRHDPGGYAVKMELYDDDWFVGKVEFHPYDEKLWVYDTKNDNDAIYVSVHYSYNGNVHNVGSFHAPGTSAVLDVTTEDLNIPEGAYVDIFIFDASGGSDYIGGVHGASGARA